MAAEKSRKSGTSSQKDSELDIEQKELDGHNSDNRQKPRSSARSLPKEEMSLHSQGDKTKSNKNSVFSKTSSVRRVPNLMLKAQLEQEKLQARLTELKQREIADLQEDFARKARTAEKKKETTKVSSGSSLRSISPVGTIIWRKS